LHYLEEQEGTNHSSSQAFPSSARARHALAYTMKPCSSRRELRQPRLEAILHIAKEIHSHPICTGIVIPGPSSRNRPQTAMAIRPDNLMHGHIGRPAPPGSILHVPFFQRPIVD
jgi:hypothetical protein